MSDKTELDLAAERASFEAASPGFNHLRHCDDSMYFSPVVEDYWQGWLLARRATIQPTADFDTVWGAIDWDVWRMKPISELVRHIHSLTSPVAPADAVRDARDSAYEAAAALCDRFAARDMHPAECAGAIRAMKSTPKEPAK